MIKRQNLVAKKCCICGSTAYVDEGEWWGNNPEPIMPYEFDGVPNRCCDHCNSYLVIPARLNNLNLYRSANNEG